MPLPEPMYQKRAPSASSGQAMGHPIPWLIADLGHLPVVVASLHTLNADVGRVSHDVKGVG